MSASTISAMPSPSDHTDVPPLPPLPPPVSVIQRLGHPSDTVSHLCQSSEPGVATFSSPLKATDIGVPESPAQRGVLPVNEEAYQEGYDSGCLRPPWEEAVGVEFDVREVEEELLPYGPPLVPPEVHQNKNTSENLSHLMK